MDITAKFLDAMRGTNITTENGGEGPKKTVIDEMLLESLRLGEPVVRRLGIGPELAVELLKRNADNRRITKVKLAQYIDDMKNGRWQENGEGISISWEGLLNNGQHRMHAIIESGTIQTMNVTVGVTRESRGTNDIGKTKSPGDHLGMRGYTSTNSLASITRMVIAHREAEEWSLGNPRTVAVTQIQAAVDEDEDLVKASEYAVAAQKKVRHYTTPSVLGFIRYLTAKIDQDASDRFLEGFLTGAEAGRGLDITDPRYRARETLGNMIKKNNTAERTEILIRAWNAYREGRTFKNNIQASGKVPRLA